MEVVSRVREVVDCEDVEGGGRRWGGVDVYAVGDEGT